MAKTRSTKKALIMSVLSLLLCCSMLIGTTFAWFTDSVVSGRNLISAGTLDVELYHSDSKVTDQPVNSGTVLFDDVIPSLWEPGAVAYENLQVTNEGTLDLKYQLSLSVLDESVVNGYKLSEVIKVGTVTGGVSGDREAVVGAVDSWTPLADFKMASTKPLAAGKQAEKVGVVLYWEPNANSIDNRYNLNNGQAGTLQLSIGVNLYATQLEAESDSFGSDYDKDAWLDAMVITTESDLNAALASGETAIVLANDIALTSALEIPAGKTVALNLDGNTLSGSFAKATGAVLVNNGTLTVYGGEVTNTADNGGAAIDNNGTLTLDGVTVSGAPIAADGYPEYAIQTAGTLIVEDGTSVSSDRGAISIDGNGTTTINGGTFTSNNISRAITAHVIDLSDDVSGEHKLTIKGGTFTNEKTNPAGGVVVVNRTTNTVYVEGGSFNGGSYTTGQNNLSDYGYHGTFYVTGGTFDSQPAAKYIAEGYEAIDNGDGTYTVSMSQETVSDLFENAEDGDTVTLSSGTFTLPATVAGKSITVEGSGDSTVLDFTKVNNVGGAAITFKNLKVQGPYTTGNSGYGIQHTTEHIAYENCTFDGAVTHEYYGSVSYTDCTFTGMGYITTYSLSSASFENCVFDKADSRAVLVFSHGDNPIDVTIDGCEFKAAKKEYTYAGDWTAAVEVDTTNIPTAGTTVTITDCTCDGNYNGIVRDKSSTNFTAVITVDGAAVVTPSNVSNVTLASNTTYKLSGDFGSKNVSLKMAQGVENVVFDGTDAANINELIIVQNGKLIDNADDVLGERSGKVTVKNFNVLSQIDVFACKTEVEICNNTAEALMVHAGNCAVNVHDNVIDANFESHPTYKDATSTWNTNDYGVTLNIFEYDLWFDGNTVTDAISHAVGINGWEGTIDTGVENEIHSFTNNNITVNSTTKTERAALKIWDDQTYASNDDDTSVVNDVAKAFAAEVLAGGNTFTLEEGRDHTIFAFYEARTNG